MYKGELDFISETISELDFRLHILRLMRESVYSDNAQDTYDSVLQYLEIIVPALNSVYYIEKQAFEERRC